MPGKENLFPQAENGKYNVCNVLNDASYQRRSDNKQEVESVPASTDSYVEENADFFESLDPEATIEEAMRMNEEEEALLGTAEEMQLSEAAEDTAAKSTVSENGVKSPVIIAQANKAREGFIEDLQSLDNEPAIRRMNITAATEVPDPSASEPASEQKENNGEKDDAVQGNRIKKPRFAKKKKEKNLEEESNSCEVVGDNKEPTEKMTDDLQPEESQNEAAEANKETPVLKAEQSVEEDSAAYSSELFEAQQAQTQSVCDDLQKLQTLLEQARPPFMHKGEVLVPKEKTLRLIRSLTAICEVNPAYIDCASEDKLIDGLVSMHSEEDYKPLERARHRAQTIISNATKQADTIINDAKILAGQLLAETEAEIKDKYDAADEQIAVRMTTAKEESSKKLNEARSELTVSRQRSVEILSKYLEKAENDYQGYWERAENTVMASLEQSESILSKAADIYQKELQTIRQDREELEEILEHLKRYRQR